MINLYCAAEKLVENNIDPAYLLASGTKLLHEEARKKLADESSLESVGIKASLLAKINLDEKTFLQ